MNDQALSGEKVLDKAKQLLIEEFGKRIVSIYALGSLAHGGFSQNVSDVDIGLIILDSLEEKDIEKVSKVTKLTSDSSIILGDRLSIFWGSVSSINSSKGGRFPPLDVLDLIKHGKLLFGEDIRKELTPPTLRTLEISSAEFAIDLLASPERLDELNHPEKIIQKGEKYISKTILFPVRFLHTSSTGEVGQNHLAVEWYLKQENLKEKKLVELGYLLRSSPIKDATQTMKLLKEDLPNLYLEFIRRYKERMHQYGERVIEKKFAEWENLIRSTI